MFILIFISGMTKKLSNERALAVIELKQKGEKDIAIEGFGLVAANSISSILEYSAWREAQEVFLSTRDKFLCKNDRVHTVENGCDCKPLANEQVAIKDPSRLLGEAPFHPVTPKTRAKVKSDFAKVSEVIKKDIIKKDPELEFHEQFLAAHPRLHEFSQETEEAYAMLPEISRISKAV